jgi:hypothetical protein
MENHPIKHHVEKSRRRLMNYAASKRPLADFLIDSNIAPLTFAGKCVNQFGWGTVVGFLLGAAAVYGYAVVKPLPLAKSAVQTVAVPTPPQTKVVQLHGRVRDKMGNPLNERFWVGVLAKQLGPVQNSDGSFVLEVPQSNTYDVALWNTDAITIYTGFAAEQDGAGYRLQDALPFLPVTRTASIESPGAKRSEPRNQIAYAQIGGR